jgi:hypothetical protein
MKKAKGQFYTTHCGYILDGFPLPPASDKIIEPFAGKGDIIKWLRQKEEGRRRIEAYDIEPPQPAGSEVVVQRRDTLAHPPDYKGAWVITNPPYLARNKSKDKSIYDFYHTNDTYKCFILSLTQPDNYCNGGVIIIPAGFFFSPRCVDVKCRNIFMTQYKITKVKYFEKSDTDLKEQNVVWVRFPSAESKLFKMEALNNWIIRGDIYTLPILEGVSVRRYVVGHVLAEGEQQTFITLNALDSKNRICLSYNKNYIYPAKECSRTYATFRITGRLLSEAEQIKICSEFNEFIEQKRKETWSLFLPQFRESKQNNARKRIPFELAYRIFLHLIYRWEEERPNRCILSDRQ